MQAASPSPPRAWFPLLEGSQFHVRISRPHHSDKKDRFLVARFVQALL